MKQYKVKSEAGYYSTRSNGGPNWVQDATKARTFTKKKIAQGVVTLLRYNSIKAHIEPTT